MGVVLIFFLKLVDFVCFVFNVVNMCFIMLERGIVLGGSYYFKDYY